MFKLMDKKIIAIVSNFFFCLAAPLYVKNAGMILLALTCNCNGNKFSDFTIFLIIMLILLIEMISCCI